MQDMGAGGLLCATVEVVQRGIKYTNQSLGCTIELHNVPIQLNCVSTILPYEIIVSESQERMLVVCEPENIEAIQSICKRWDIESAVIGTITSEETYTLTYQHKVIMSSPFSKFSTSRQDWPLTPFPKQNSQRQKIKDTSLWTQYDHTIGCRTVKGPLEPGSYSLISIPEAENQILVITWGETFEECHDMMLAHKGKPYGIINCLNFGHPRDSMGEFAKTIDTLNTHCRNHKIPVLGGNVSLYNSTNHVSIKPTPVFVMVGIQCL